MMQKIFLFWLLLFTTDMFSQNSIWQIVADDIDPNNYYGIIVANGMVGVVSSPEPMQVTDVVLNGVYDYYQRGRVSNILKTFNHVNMSMDINGQRTDRGNISEYKQTLNMKEAFLETIFRVGNYASVVTKMMSLRNLPYTALITVSVKANNDIRITSMSEVQAPNHLTDVRNYYSEIDRPHIKIPLLTSVGLSPSGRTSSYKPNEVPPFGVISEVAGGSNPYFATDAVGMLQAVINEFGRLEIADNGVKQVTTNLPKGWVKLINKGAGIDEKT